MSATLRGMTPKQRLQTRQVECRARLGEITALDGDDYSDEIRTEERELIAEMRSLDQRLLACDLADDGSEPQEVASVDGQDADRIELRQRAKATNYLVSAIRGTALSGAEAELAAEIGTELGHIPLEVFDVPEMRARVEHRADAVTPSPSTGTGVNVDAIHPLIYARSVVPRLGVAMPTVPSGTFSTMTVTTGLTAGAKAKGAAQESTAATLTPRTTTPKRVSARLSVALEDIASIGVAGFETALRENLMLALSDRLDHLGLTGDGTAPNPHGLIPQLADPTDPTDVVTWESFVSTIAAGIDGGPWAESLQSIMVCANAETLRLAETTFQKGTGTDTPGEQSAAAYLRANTAGFFASARMPATVSTIAKAVLYRAATMGLNGVNAVRTATMPVWDRLSIDDIYSDSASAIRHFTVHHVVGDVVLQQPDAYSLIEFKLSS